MSKQWNILVVDDEHDIRELCELMLMQEGYMVRTAASYEEALEHLASFRFDLLITDIHMPGKNGSDLIRQVQITNPALPKIAMTSYGTLEKEVEKLGASALVRKPFLSSEFLVVIERVLQGDRKT